MLITGLFDTASRIRGLVAGPDDFTSKPIEAGVLIACVRSLLRVKHVTDPLERTEDVVFALARTVEARDAYTDQHLWRHAEYRKAMADALGCTTLESRYARYGGLLHDIGKVGIAPLVMVKPGALTREEFEGVKRHPEIGAGIVSSMRFAPASASRGIARSWTSAPTCCARDELPNPAESNGHWRVA